MKKFDVIIIGGSYAGLSAALALGRSLRKVLVIDSGLPCNRSTPHSHNFLTHDGERPADIAEKAKAELLAYETVKFQNGMALSGRKTEKGFEIITQEGETFYGRKLIFATGISDVLPDIPGFAECWGISVIHCPYCHGYEFRGRTTGIIANGDKAFHLVSLVRNLAPAPVILTSGQAAFTAEQSARLEKYGIRVIEEEITEIAHENGWVRQVIIRSGERVDFEAVYAALPFTQHSGIPASLDCELTEHGYIRTDAFQKTTVNGVFACGDNAGMMRSVANAVAGGSMTGAMVNAELAREEFS